MTRIIVSNNLAFLTNDPYVFVGTTGEGGWFPEIGADEEGFSFTPLEACSGTLVFDLKQARERNPTTPKFYRYWWEKSRLIVKVGLKHLPREYHYDSYDGLYHLVRLPGETETTIYSPYGQRSAANPVKVVSLLDLIRFFEGKINLEDMTVSEVRSSKS